MHHNQELNLSAAFSTNTDIQIPKWLTTSGRPVQCFYATMKLWERLTSQVKGLALPSNLKEIFPVLKQHTFHFPTIVGFCEARPEMLKMLKTALYGVTYGCFEENKEELNAFRYNYALDTAFSLMVVPRSQKCHHPEFMTEDGHVEKALVSTIQNIFKIVLDQMKSEGRGDHVDYMIYACSHFSSPESGYSRAGRKAVRQGFKDYYADMPPEERAMIVQSHFYVSNLTTQELIDELVQQARNQVRTIPAQTAPQEKERKLV